MRRPSARPGPRKLRIEVRLALSYEALKMNGTFSERVTPLMTSAMNSACFSLSMTHGPAMRNKLPEPMWMPSTWKESDKGVKRFNHIYETVGGVKCAARHTDPVFSKESAISLSLKGF